MDIRLALGLGTAVELAARLAREIARGSTPLRQTALEAEAGRLLRREAPLSKTDQTSRLLADVVGMGPLQELMEDDAVSDVLVNGLNPVWVDRGSGLEETSIRFRAAAQLEATIERVLAPLGLRLDRASPMVDARLPDGSRFHAVIPPASVEGSLLAIRRFTQRVSSLEGLIAAGTASRDQVALLSEAVRSRRTIVVSGGTGAGKTTLLNLLAAVIPPSERIVTIEDAAELSFPGHVVRLEARPANAEGTGEITVRNLLRSALRLRPDRVIVGEVRGAEAIDLISALNTGHAGSMTTVHANSPRQALLRLETLAMMAGEVSELAVSRQLRAAVDVIVQIERSETGRRITEIAAIEDFAEDER